MKYAIMLLLILCFLFPQLASARTLIVAADSTEEFLHVADAASAAEAGDTVLVRDGWYMEVPITVDSGVVVVAENSGQVELWMLNPDWVFITLNGTAKIMGMQINGHWAGFAQTLVEINGGPATIYNCLFRPYAHYGLQMAFYSAGQSPVIRYCQFYVFSGGNPIVHNFDSTRVWMPHNYYQTTDTVFIHHLIEWSYPGGEIYISPVLDSFQWLSVEDRPLQAPRIQGIQVYPNPTNSSAVLSYSLPPGVDPVRVRLYNILGQSVFFPETQLTGFGQIHLQLSSFASGSYWIVLEDRHHQSLARTRILLLR